MKKTPIEHVMQFFAYDHLPEGELRDTSEACATLAKEMEGFCPHNPELTVGLRKLLEAKDAFVRAQVAGMG